MNRTDLTAAVADHADLTPVQASLAVQAVFDAMTRGLAGGERVTVTGFGSLAAVDRAARKGRNPRTGEMVPVAPKRTVRFTPGTRLEGYMADPSTLPVSGPVVKRDSPGRDT